MEANLRKPGEVSSTHLLYSSFPDAPFCILLTLVSSARAQARFGPTTFPSAALENPCYNHILIIHRNFAFALAITIYAKSVVSILTAEINQPLRTPYVLCGDPSSSNATA
jgi:hypothetical protein